jgi:rhodanese-related sulfurtransferase
MGLDTSTASAALKEDYQPVIREQLNDINVVLSQIEKNTEDTEGLEAVLSLHVTRNSGVGARAEGGTLPTAGNQGYVKERIPLRRNYGRIEVSGPVIRAMKSDKGSWTRAVESETKGLVRDSKKDVNRQVNGTSNGVIATCGVTGASTTVVLAATTSAVQMRQFEVNMVVDIGTVANPTSVASARTISAVDRTNKTITISGAVVNTAGTDFVFRSGAGGSGASQKELTGLQTIVDDANSLFSVDPATYEVWKSYVDGNGGVARNFTEALLEEAMDETNIKSGETSWLVVTSHGAARNFAAQLKAQRRYNDTIELKGGFKGLKVETPSGDCTIVTDRDHKAATATGLSVAHLTQYEASDWEWMDDDGAVLSRVQNKDAYEATLFKYHELATDERGAHFLIEDLAES